MTHKPFLDLIMEHAECDTSLKHVALKAIHPDFTARGGFQWAFPGHWTIDPRDTGKYSEDVCPRKPGDGLSLAKTVEGMAQGGYSPATVLVVGFHGSDLIAEDEHKLKVRKAKTLAVVDGIRTIRTFGAGADLGWANLNGAKLTGAKLNGADLNGADLRRANLYGAKLTGADLGWANLYGAKLTGADLRRADLTGADLRRADLTGAKLNGADLGSHSRDSLRKRGADL